MIKARNIYLLLTALVLFLSGCDKENKLSPTEDLGIVDMFSPDENADPRVKAMYNLILPESFLPPNSPPHAWRQ